MANRSTGTRPGPRSGSSPQRRGQGRGQGRGAPRGRNPVSNARRGNVVRQRNVPWMLIGGIALIVVLVGGLAYALLARSDANAARDSVLAPYRPTAENKDPSTKIPGVVVQNYTGQHHIAAPIRVRYDHSPPFGGPHDQYWAACTGVVYPNPVRNENMVHALEHGAVWIAYDASRVSGPALAVLTSKVQGVGYTLMSPYPGLDQPISLQSWGHQLKLADANDPRIDQFIAALRQNPNTYPEQGASCDALGPGAFDPDNPPPFESGPFKPLGKGSVDMNYQGSLDGKGGSPAAPGAGAQADPPSSRSSKSPSTTTSKKSSGSSSSSSESSGN